MTTVGHHMTESENAMRNRRKGSYHLVSSRNKLPTDPEEEEEDQLFRFLTSTSNKMLRQTENFLLIQGNKAQLLRELASSGGDTTTQAFQDALGMLTKVYDPTHFDARKIPSRPSSSSRKRNENRSPQMEGMWIDVTKPKFSGSLGMNENHDYLYTLGRMSFDIFRPTKLVCSIQGTFNPVHFVCGSDAEAIERVPKSLKAELKHGSNVLRTYDIVTAFTIEAHKTSFGPDSPNLVVDRPIEGLLTTFGYILPNPEKRNRLSIWFTGGTIEVNEDHQRWHKVFGQSKLPKRNLKEQIRVLGAKIAMGATPPEKMEQDGRMCYHLNRPFGGHEIAYVDIVYLDDTLRIARASSGVVYVFARVPYFPDE